VVIRLIPGWTLSRSSSTVAIAVYATEFAFGAALVAAMLGRLRQQSR
jgi:hypothetical protein